jgi:hypothetical protein
MLEILYIKICDHITFYDTVLNEAVFVPTLEVLPAATLLLFMVGN